MTNHYKLLGVLPSASAEEIRAAYLARIKLCHPDAAGPNNPAREEEAQELNRAYSVLRDSSRRAAHDAELGLLLRPAPPVTGVPVAIAVRSPPRRPSRRARTAASIFIAIALGTLIGVLTTMPSGGGRPLPLSVAPEPRQSPPIDEGVVADAGSDAYFIAVNGNAADASAYSQGCFVELSQSPNLKLMDRCIAFDLAASRWLPMTNPKHDSAFFAAAHMGARHKAAFRRIGFDDEGAEERLRKLDRLVVTDISLRLDAV